MTDTATVTLSSELLDLIDEYRLKLDALSISYNAGLISDIAWKWHHLQRDFAQELEEGISRDDLIDVISDELPDNLTDEEFDDTFDSLMWEINHRLWSRVLESTSSHCAQCGAPVTG